jgi:hypothetical protein
MMLRRIFGHEREETAGGCRKLYMAHIREIRNAYNILDGKPEGKTQLRRLGIHERIILKWI